MQALPASPESLCIVEMGGTPADTKEDAEDGGTKGGLFLNIGLQVCLSVTCSEFHKQLMTTFKWFNGPITIQQAVNCDCLALIVTPLTLS